MSQGADAKLKQSEITSLRGEEKLKQFVLPSLRAEGVAVHTQIKWRNFMKKLLLLTIVFFAFTGCKKSEKNTSYVASTSWTAGIAQMAGIDDVKSIAPANLKHPPEYEITPMDILAVSEAELFIFAGYERMMETISNAAEVDKSKIIKIKTANTLQNIKEMTMILSEKAGTQEKAKKRVSQFENLILETRKKIIQNGLDKKTFYVNKNQAEFAKDLGLNVVATFGPAPLTAEQIAFAAENQFDFIIDNVHNPVAAPAAEVSPNSKILIWRNFPSKNEQNALYKVVEENCKSLL